MNLGKNVKKLRKEKGWSQSQLSEKVGCHLTHINRIETSKYIPSLEITAKIAEIFRVSIDDLVYDDSGSIDELDIKDLSFKEKMRRLNSLGDEEKEVINKVIDAMWVKKRVLGCDK